MGSPGLASGPSGLASLAERVRPVVLARDQQLPVLPPLETLLPGGGLRRGTTVAVGAAPGIGGGAMSLALALAAGPSQAGSWVAAIGMPSLGLVAATDLGVALDRLVLVAAPERDAWATVAAALVDGFDVVLLQPRRGMRAADARRLVARARERGAVLIAVGGPFGDAPDVRLEVVAGEWRGLGGGHGHLQRRLLTIEAGGRREAARPRRAELWLPSPVGAVDEVVADPVPLHRVDRSVLADQLA